MPYSDLDIGVVQLTLQRKMLTYLMTLAEPSVITPSNLALRASLASFVFSWLRVCASLRNVRSSLKLYSSCFVDVGTLGSVTCN